MSISVGTNSWVTISEADNYLTDRVGTSAWFALSDSAAAGTESKTTYLVTACQWLLSEYPDDLVVTLIDENLKKAQIEAALYLLNNYTDFAARSALSSQGVVEFEYSDVREKFNNSGICLPPIVYGFISDLLYSGDDFPTIKSPYDV